MKTYADLQKDHFYLIVAQEGEDISLVEPLMQTNNAVLLMHHDDMETSRWYKKTEAFFELVDELTEEQLEEHDELFDLSDDFDPEEEELDENELFVEETIIEEEVDEEEIVEEASK